MFNNLGISPLNPMDDLSGLQVRLPSSRLERRTQLALRVSCERGQQPSATPRRATADRGLPRAVIADDRRVLGG